jgi:hypothetical protein
MANKDKTKDALPNLNLAPINTPQGAMERTFYKGPIFLDTLI